MPTRSMAMRVMTSSKVIAGDDNLSGGGIDAALDIFLFDRTESANETDTILDFELGTDKIQFQNYTNGVPIVTLSDVGIVLTLTENNHLVVISGLFDIDAFNASGSIL